MHMPKSVWFVSFSFVLMLHIVAFELLLASKKSVSLEQNFGGFDYPIKDDVFESVMIVSDLPIGEFKQVAINLTKSAQPQPNLQSQDEPEISPVKDIKSDISAVQKPKEKKQKPKEKLKKEPPKQEIKPDTKPTKEIENVEKSEPTQSVSSINSSAKDSFASAPISGTSTKIATNTTGVSRTNKQSWKGLVVSHLNKHKRYPSSALSNSEEGIVSVRVVVAKDGEILHAEIKKPTKFQSLNAEAVEIFHRASPLPTPPSEYFKDKNELVINFPIEFNIKKYKQSLR